MYSGNMVRQKTESERDRGIYEYYMDICLRNGKEAGGVSSTQGNREGTLYTERRTEVF